MNIIFKNICKFLSCEHLASEDGKVSLTEAQLSDLESAMQANHDMIAELSIKVKNAEDENKKLTETNKSLDEANKTLEAKVANLPAASTTAVVDDKNTRNMNPQLTSSSSMLAKRHANSMTVCPKLINS